MRIYIFIILLLSSTPLALAQGMLYPEDQFKVSIPLGKKYDYSRILVTRVIDGNTLLLENGERVVLIGLDAPENRTNSKAKRDSQKLGKPLRVIKLMGRRSAKFVEDLVLEKAVRLEFDVQEKDQYGRLLAYVYLISPENAGEIFLNAEIIKQGYALPKSMPSNVKHDPLFQELYQEAIKEQRGLWLPK